MLHERRWHTHTPSDGAHVDRGQAGGRRVPFAFVWRQTRVVRLVHIDADGSVPAESHEAILLTHGLGIRQDTLQRTALFLRQHQRQHQQSLTGTQLECVGAVPRGCESSFDRMDHAVESART